MNEISNYPKDSFEEFFKKFTKDNLRTCKDDLPLLAKSLFGKRTIQELEGIFEHLVDEFNRTLDIREMAIDKISDILLEDDTHWNLINKAEKITKPTNELDKGLIWKAVLAMDILRLIRKRKGQLNKNVEGQKVS